MWLLFSWYWLAAGAALTALVTAAALTELVTLLAGGPKPRLPAGASRAGALRRAESIPHGAEVGRWPL